MIGKHHVQITILLTGTIITGLSFVHNLTQFYTIDFSGFSLLLPSEITLSFSNGFFMETFIFIVIAFASLIFGCLLPDIDSPTSMLGKIFYLNVGHRTWTHSIWAVALLGYFSIRYYFVRWLLLGYCLHLIEDSVSAAGLCFLYPFKRYRKYGHAFVAPGHKLKLYHTGTKSEKVFVKWFIIVNSCLILYFGFWQRSLEHLFYWLIK